MDRIYGDYPNLYVDNPLDVGRGSLISTVSCDEYFAELALWFGVDRTDLSTVFPNVGRFYDPSSTNLPLNFMNGVADPPMPDKETATPQATATSQTPQPLTPTPFGQT